MENQLEKRYGLVTAICVVVGIVVGSGVFFKAEKILVCTDGRTSLGILAWLRLGTPPGRYQNQQGLLDSQD